jgi:hypothetical protein
MARENQGLQIAMIVFVLLTIVFGVTTFLFFSQYKEASKKALAADQAASKESATARDAIKQMDDLKKMMGFAETENVGDIQKGFAADMEKYAKTYPAETRFYRQALQRQAGVIKEKDESLANEQAAVAKLKADLAAQTAMTKLEIEKHDKAAQAAQKDKEGELGKFNADRDQLKGTLTKMDADFKQSKKDSDAAQADLQNKLAATTKDLGKVTDTYEIAKGKLNDMQRESPDKFQGEIRWVNQYNRVVWIDLGEADALRPQTTFGVYAAGKGDMTEVGKKASIEVTRVLGSHLAEARLLDDAGAGPVRPGARLYTPVCGLGEKRHFAIAGKIDLNGDGYCEPAELQRLHTLIEMNGGVVDSRTDAQGKRDGKIDLNTRYLILGKRPDASSPEAERNDYSQMSGEAKRLRVEEITVEKFLDQMGWKRRSEIVNYGAGGENSFAVRPDESPRVSTGQISERFKPRKPPRTSGGSVY